MVIQDLMRKGFGYTVDGDVYFDVSSFKDYGHLSRQSLDSIKAGARVVATDINRLALACASRNAIANGATDLIHFRWGSLFVPDLDVPPNEEVQQFSRVPISPKFSVNQPR
jgi:hypothetical protein